MSLLLFMACGGSNNGGVALETADTLQVKELVGKFRMLLETSNVDAAAEMLYYDDNGDIKPINDSIKLGMKEAYTMFPIKECRMEYYKIKGYDDNSVKLRLVFASPNPAKPMETAVLLKPTCVNDQWFLVIGLGDNDLRAF